MDSVRLWAKPLTTSTTNPTDNDYFNTTEITSTRAQRLRRRQEFVQNSDITRELLRLVKAETRDNNPSTVASDSTTPDYVPNMNPDIRIDVPQLDLANYGPWLLALRAAAFNYEANDHLTGDPPLPTTTQDIQVYHKKKNYLIGKIVSTIPNDIANLLIAPDTDPTPHTLVTKIKEHLNTANANDHRYLKSLAESTHFLPDMTLSEYVSTHEKIRARMIASQYPKITDPKITVEFMIEGLKHNQATSHIGLQLIALQPVDLKDFTHQFNRIQSYQGVTVSTPQPHGLSATASSDIQELLRLLRRKQTPRNEPYRQRDFKPCKFHISKGVANPRHSDENCRDPDHPRHRRSRRNPRRAAARATNTDYLPELVTQLQQLIHPHPRGDRR